MDELERLVNEACTKDLLAHIRDEDEKMFQMLEESMPPDEFKKLKVDLAEVLTGGHLSIGLRSDGLD